MFIISRVILNKAQPLFKLTSWRLCNSHACVFLRVQAVETGFFSFGLSSQGFATDKRIKQDSRLLIAFLKKTVNTYMQINWCWRLSKKTSVIGNAKIIDNDEYTHYFLGGYSLGKTYKKVR